MKGDAVKREQPKREIEIRFFGTDGKQLDVEGFVAALKAEGRK